MRVIKSCIIAFSMYSRIPVPQFKWKDGDMKYALCFFPWVGAVIGVCVYFWRVLCERFEIGNLGCTLLSTAIPLLVTGGFHVGGYMDTMDAFRSYQPREKKLEILKDSHIGAFSVIMLGVYGLIYLAAFSEIQNTTLLSIVCAGFALARCLCGISVISFPSAKKERIIVPICKQCSKKHSESIAISSRCGVRRIYAVAISACRNCCGNGCTWCICMVLLSVHEGTWWNYR